MSGLSAKLQEPVDETADALADRRIGPKPDSAFEIGGIRELVDHFAAGREVNVRASSDGKMTEFNALVRIDTPQEALYYANGGILQYVLRQLLASKPQTVGV